MLRVRFFRVRPERVERLRWWMSELVRRRDEVLETFVNETVRHEAAWLLDTSDGPLLAYAIEAEDLQRAQSAFEETPLPIDVEHRRVMAEVLGDALEADQVLDVSV